MPLFLKVKSLISFKNMTMRKKNLYYILLLTVFAAGSCSKDDIGLYEGDSYVQFKKGYVDSSLFSFLTLGSKTEAPASMVVELVGKPVDKDRTYKITVVKALSTASEANYSLPASFTFRANRTTDTAWFTLKKTTDISLKPVKLVLKLEASDELGVGQTDHAAAILYISNIIARPDWWDDKTEGRYLGEYTDKKYKLFIQVTGVSDVDSSSDEQLRYYTLLFKNYLLREKDAGRTVYEDNGAEMIVEYAGG